MQEEVMVFEYSFAAKNLVYEIDARIVFVVVMVVTTLWVLWGERRRKK